MASRNELDLAEIRSLYLESLDWWEAYSTPRELNHSKLDVDDYLKRWCNALEHLFRSETGLQADRNVLMTKTVDLAIQKNRGTPKPINHENDFTLALWGYYDDLREFLKYADQEPVLRLEKCKRHELLALVHGRPAITTQFADTYSVFNSVVCGLDRTNLESIISAVGQSMHAYNANGFNAEKVALLRTLLALKQEQEDLIDETVTVNLETIKVPLDEPVTPENSRTAVTLRWIVSPISSSHELRYKIRVDCTGISLVSEQDNTNPQFVDNLLAGSRIETQVRLTGSDRPEKMKVYLEIYYFTSSRNRVKLYEHTYNVSPDYRTAFTGNQQIVTYSKLHEDMAKVLICRRGQLIHAVGTSDFMGPANVIAAALRECLDRYIRENKAQVVEICDEPHFHPDCRLTIVYSNRQISDDELDKWDARYLRIGANKRTRIVFVEVCESDHERVILDRLANKRTQRSDKVKTLILDDGLVSVDWQADCEYLLSGALPGVMFDNPAHSTLVQLLKPYRKWKDRMAIIGRVTDRLQNRLPYVDLRLVREVWDSLESEGMISLMDGLDREQSVVLDVLRQEYKRTGAAQSVGSIMKELLATTVLSFRQTVMGPEELARILDSLCDLQRCERVGLFLYAPNSEFWQVEHI